MGGESERRSSQVEGVDARAEPLANSSSKCGAACATRGGLSGRSGAVRVTAAWITGAALVALHVAPWRPSAHLVLGWLPAELAWRLGWTLLAWVWLLAFCRWVWREKPNATGAPLAAGRGAERERGGSGHGAERDRQREGRVP